MPRMTVYVSDELWESVRGRHPASKQSELVQEGLKSLIENRNAVPEYARERPYVDPDRLKKIKSRLVAASRQVYESGYEFGLETAERLDWWLLRILPRSGWDLNRWLRSDIQPREDMGSPLIPLATYAGLEEYDLHEEGPFALGFVQAIKETWESLDESEHQASIREE